jgi:hypothetical protein
MDRIPLPELLDNDWKWKGILHFNIATLGQYDTMKYTAVLQHKDSVS